MAESQRRKIVTVALAAITFIRSTKEVNIFFPMAHFLVLAKLKNFMTKMLHA